MDQTCSRCGGQVAKATVHDHDGFVVLRPEKRGILDLRYSGLIAHTCTRCGLTEFFADMPESLIQS